jgi:hypothetical protein
MFPEVRNPDSCGNHNTAEGRTMANEGIFSHLVEQRDLESIARDIASAIRR